MEWDMFDWKKGERGSDLPKIIFDLLSSSIQMIHGKVFARYGDGSIRKGI